MNSTPKPAMNRTETVEQLQIPSTDTMIEALRRVFESKMIACYQPLDDDREVVAFLHLGPSWISAVAILTDLLVEADPACAEDARELACAYTLYCRRLERTCTPNALSERKDAARRIISTMTASATRNLGREFSVFEVENSSLHFKVKGAHPLESEPSIVGIWEVCSSPVEADPLRDTAEEGEAGVPDGLGNPMMGSGVM